VKAIVASGSRVKIAGPEGAVLEANYDGGRIYAMQTKPGEPAGRCHFPWGRCGVYIKDVRVVGVEGGGDVGLECKRLFRDTPGSNCFTEIMFGYHPKASTERGIQDPMHWEILIRYPWVGLGTPRKELHYQHIDGGCMESSLAIDGRVIVDFGGRLTLLDDPEIRSATARYGDPDFILPSISHEGPAVGGL